VSDQVLSVKDWGRFQQYKDRNPKWIKLYLSLLDDYDFQKLEDATKAHLLLIWLLAARCDNRIPFDHIWIANRIGVRHKDLRLEPLIEGGWLFVREDPEVCTDDKKVRTDVRTSKEGCLVPPGEKRREEERRGETEQTRAHAGNQKPSPEFAEQF
jgi:hypothetical protein